MASANRLTPQEVQPQVPELRRQFKQKYAAAISGGEYDARDLQRLDTDDAYVRCFLRTHLSKGNVGKSLPLVDSAFKFRKEFQINDLNDAYFPQEVKDKKAIYYKGHDINGHPIVYLQSKLNSAKDAQAIKYQRQYIAYTFEQHHSKNPEVMVVALVDMSGAGMGNLNHDTSKFILACFSTYFPSFLAYMINFEMPFILNAVWTLITPFLNSDQKNQLIIVGKKDITKYISEDNLWDHMKK